MTENVAPFRRTETSVVEIALEAELDSWQSSVSDTAYRSRHVLRANATLRMIKPTGGLEICCVKRGEILEITEITAEVFIKRRYQNKELPPAAAESEPVEFDMRGTLTPEEMSSQEPIGTAIFDLEDHRYRAGPDTIFIDVDLDASLFDRLLNTYLSDQPMPARMSFDFARSAFTRIDHQSIVPMIDFAGATRSIRSVSFSYDRSWHEDHSSWREPVPIGILQRFIKRINWEQEAWYFEHYQFMAMLSELLASDIQAARKSKGKPGSPDYALGEAYDLSKQVYDHLLDGERVTVAARKRQKSKITDKKESSNLPWRKKDLSSDMEDGLDSRYWSSISKDGLADICYTYLHSDFYSPTLEWVVADIYAYAETRDFAEHMKQTSPALGGLLNAYDSSAGNVMRMYFKAAPRMFAWYLAKTAIWATIPLIYAYQQWQKDKTDNALLILAGIAAMFFILPKVKAFFGFGSKEKYEGAKKQLELHGKMATAYRRIDLSMPPFIAKEALLTAANAGAVWDGDLWSLILKAEKRDPAVWEHRGPDEFRALKNGIRKQLKKALHEQTKAGLEISRPAFDAEESN